jgi:hypothetical protein
MVELVPVRAIYASWATLDDWELLLALHRHERRWDGLMTNDDAMLSLAKEMTVLSQTGLTLVVAKGEGHNPIRAVGALLCHLPHICHHTTPEHAIEIDTARGSTRALPPTPPASAGRRRATRKRTIVAAPVTASSPTPAKRAIRSKPRKAAKTAQRPTQLRGMADLIAAALSRALTGGRRRGRHNP